MALDNKLERLMSTASRGWGKNALDSEPANEGDSLPRAISNADYSPKTPQE